MRISIIFTGGTIGSLTKSEWVGIDSSAKYMLLSRFENTDGEISFETVAPYSVLSENLTATELNLLQTTVRQVLDTKPDGVIITHGTDTLQYSAAAVAMAFADADVPLVFVSADYPLDNDRTNGYRNFEAAVAFIRHGGYRGVFVSYQNENADTVTVHPALRLLQHGEGLADLHSLGGATVAAYDTALHPKDYPPVKAPSPLGIVTYCEDAAILVAESLPGQRYAYDLDGVRAVLLKPYHSATLNTDSEALAALCRRAYERGIPVFVYGVKAGPAYESSARFEELHIRIAPYSTFAALYMKLWAAISLGRDLERFVNTPVADEVPCEE